MDDHADRFLDALNHMEEVTEAISARDAHSEFDETTLQVFWKKWPDLSAWAGTLWRMLSDELAEPATPPTDPDLHEVGGSG